MRQACILVVCVVCLLSAVFSGARAHASRLNVTVAGIPLSSASVIQQDGLFWASAEEAGRAFGVTLRQTPDAVLLDQTPLPSLVKAGRRFVSLTALAEICDGVVERKGDALHVLSRVTDVRFNGRELRISATLPVRGVVKRLQDPERVYVDLPGARLDGPPSETSSRTSLVRRLRVGQYDALTARVTAETAGRVEFSVVSPARSQTFAVALKGPAGIQAAAAEPRPEPAETDVSIQTPPGGQQPQEPVTIRSVRLSSDQDTVRFTIATDAPAAPQFGMDASQGLMWLDFGQALVTSTDRMWTLTGGLSLQARLDGFAESPPRARLTVSSARLLTSRIVRGASPGELVWVLGVPEGAEGGWRGKTVIVDAGHGGTDTGAQANGLREKDVNLAIALLTADELRQRGLHPVLTRKDDRTLSLRERTDMIAANRAALFVSIHCNSNPKPGSVSGTEVYYHGQDPDSRALAEIVHANLVAAMGTKARGARSDLRLYSSGLFVLRNSPVPAILVEAGYLNHSGDAALLKDAGIRQKAAAAIAEGIQRYLGAPGGEPVSLLQQPAVPLGPVASVSGSL